MKRLHLIGITLCSLMLANTVFARDLDKTVRADKATYFRLQALGVLPISVEFTDAAGFYISIDSTIEAYLTAYSLDDQFRGVYLAEPIKDNAIDELALALSDGIVSDVADVVRANYQFRN